MAGNRHQWCAGAYGWARAVHGSSLRRPIRAQPAAFDDRSRAEIDLSHVETAIRTLAQGGMVQEYSIGSRNLKRFRMAELLQLRDELKNEIAMERKRERIRQGLGNPGLAKVRFT
jgi:hypothetical protein